jgi:fucose 4-O-acetylase-like acetyltransferase
VSLAGAALIALGLFAATRPAIYHASAFWTSSPTWFSIRAGVMMIALAAVYAMSRIRRGVMSAWQDRLAQMGRNSLFVYWIHVELVYGYASWLWRGRLPLWGTAAAALMFTALMYYAVVVRDRVVQTGKLRGGQPMPVQSANA